ncbi:hypothetical protein [Neorhizobium sp. AL 9.2.2]|uniref:hypothetical protein n=1 Tax=Neorhizobium sp. AL 9.2.2 TaxID=2712894 RepID=UPI001574D29A|nr:hypothetical protein [Neorhizobium sp. AL 9.2.2]NSY19760.1 hypothetical protein [Neorhizobium sp. AL 9.2.2]
MRIGVILQSEDSRQSAGVRIRYDRLRPWLVARGHTLDLMPIETIDPSHPLAYEVYLFCKCHDIRSLLLADAMKAAGASVGIDLFDDYYTQTSNSRFVHMRDWLRAIRPDLSFALCSTAAMRDRLDAVLSGVPLHILNDPYEQFDAEAIGQAVAHNMDRARQTRQLDIGWFGMGDNPHFPLGLHDLTAHGEAIRLVRRAGYRPRLTILTNRRALSADGLEMISRLGVPYRLEEWSEALEQALIGSSVACLLPVNAQSFSIVKSINRAITTLTGGSQVLSTGFPLYAPLEPFVYRRVDALLADIEAGAPALRQATTASLAQTLSDMADPDIEAGRLSDFLKSLGPRPAQPRPAMARSVGGIVLFGRQSPEPAFSYVRATPSLSVASPFAPPGQDYDVVFQPDPKTGYADLLLSERAVAHLAADVKPFLKPVPKSPRGLRQLPGDALPMRTRLRNGRKPNSHLSVDLSQYADTMRTILRLLGDLFPAAEVFVSETGAPFTTQRPGSRDPRRGVADSAPASPPFSGRATR